MLSQLLAAFPHAPTQHQAAAFRKLAAYLPATDRHHVMVLKGAAGTGKTSLLQAVATTLRQHKRRVVLLAPTGRAAKVAAARTGLGASTIHFAIYTGSADAVGNGVRLKPNAFPAGTVYIIDEASMLSDVPPEGFGAGADGLLRDVLRFCWKSSPEARIVLVGDPAQLPPIGASRSPALSEKYLRETLNLSVTSANMTEVMRQALESGILRNATALRAALAAGMHDTLPVLQTAPDVQVLECGQDAMDVYQSRFDPERPERVVLLTASNGAAAAFNKAIRNVLHHEPDELTEGDVAMAVRNHYYKPENAGLRFVANGELGLVRKVVRASRHTAFGHEWMEAEVEFPGEAGPESLAGLVPLSLVYSKQPSLGGPELRALRAARVQHLEALNAPTHPVALRQDPYLSAIQLKMGYAVTGHKAQGGQWEHVLVVFEPFLFRAAEPDGKPRSLLEALRWTYTALTRASQCVYLLRPPFPMQPG